MFSPPDIQFISKLTSPSDMDSSLPRSLLHSCDILTDKVYICGTTYKIGHILVKNCICEDLLEVGVIQKIVVRNQKPMFLISLYECARNDFNVFEALSMNRAELLSYEDCDDYKPLIMRGEGECFKFVLHHRILKKQI